MKRIKKIAQSIGVLGKVLNSQTTSSQDTYSCDYINGIVESGSNTNGNYVKYADGTMICYGIIYEENISSTTWGNIYICTLTAKNFAETFVSVPNIIISPYQEYSSQATASVGAVVGTTTTTTGDITLMRGSVLTNGVVRLSYQAIGKWK